MDTPQLASSEDPRFMRKAGITLLMASGMLVFFMLPSASALQEPSENSPLAAATTPASNAFTDIPLEAQAAIVYDFAQQKTLYEKNANAQLPLASLTKLLTVYSAITTLPSETLISIPEEVAHLPAPRAFLPHQTFTLSDIARLTLVASLNDGAMAIARTIAAQHNSEHEALAAVASALHLSQTYALNGSGLDITSEISGGYGSARDVATLAGTLATKAPHIVNATTKNYAEATAIDGTQFKVKNTDPMVDTIPRLLLSKTGYTSLAGGNLALVIDVGVAHPVAIVVLGSSAQDRFTDGNTLIQATLAHFAQTSSL